MIRYEANPPKIAPGVDVDAAVERAAERIAEMSRYCGAVHITEDVLGRRRVPPLVLAAKISDCAPRMQVTVSMRVRDRSASQIAEFARECAATRVSGVLAVMGDPREGGPPDSGQTASGAVGILRSAGLKPYLSMPAEPRERTLASKTAAGPDGFVTQVVSSAEQARALCSKLDGFKVIPIVMFSSPKNLPSARLLGIPMSGDFADLLSGVVDAAGDALITSPSDFAGLLRFFATS